MHDRWNYESNEEFNFPLVSMNGR